MQLSLESPARKTLWLTAALVTALLYAYGVQRELRAQLWGSSLQVAGLERAVSLEPGDAELHHKLGRFYLFAQQTPELAVKQLREAVRLNPGVGWIWLDLATAYRSSGDDAHAREAVLQALKVDPRTPAVAWEAANMFLASGETEKAVQQLRTVVENDPDSGEQAYYLAWRALGSTEQVLQQIPAPTAKAHFDLIRVLLRGQDATGAMAAWHSLVKSREGFHPVQALFLVDYLLQRNQVENAKSIWADLSQIDGNWQPRLNDRGSGDGTVDGGFEEDLPAGGFNWVIGSTPSVTAQIDDAEFHSGSRSLRLEFNGEGGDETAASEFVAVRPNTQYELMAYVKAEALESAGGGPVLSVSSEPDAAVGASSEAFTGSTGWHEVHLTFKTGTSTQLVRIRLRRMPAAKLVRGRLWLDDVKLYQH